MHRTFDEGRPNGSERPKAEGQRGRKKTFNLGILRGMTSIFVDFVIFFLIAFCVFIDVFTQRPHF